MPAERFGQQMRRMLPIGTGAGALHVVGERVTVVRVRAGADDGACSLLRCQAAQIGEALLGHNDLHIVLGMVNV